MKTKERIIAAADQLFYQQGFDHTSFADIADAVNISRGNFYHHFKSKDEILTGVIAKRLTNTQLMLDQWQRESDTPQECIRSFINILIMNSTKIKNYGCPVGTLCSELAKLDHPLQSMANRVFALFRDWLSAQFVLMGRAENSDELALHILMRSQGVATLGNAFQDDQFIRREVDQMYEWLDHIVNQHQ